MKRYFFIIVFLFFIPLMSFAGWQVSSPVAAVPREPFFPGSPRTKGPIIVPSPTYRGTNFSPFNANLGQPKAVYCMSLSGSLKENLERIMGRYRWRVVWKAPYDFNFDGRVTGSSLPNVVQKLLQPFPLQAVMYMSNRTVMIVPRTKTGLK